MKENEGIKQKTPHICISHRHRERYGEGRREGWRRAEAAVGGKGE